MQLTWMPIHPWTIIVKNPIGDITTLLYFSQQDSATNGMYSSRRYIEHITRLHFMSRQNLGNGSILHPFLVLIRRYLLFEPGIQERTRIGINNVPHLRFSHFAMLAKRHLIIRMNLDTQIFLCINKFGQQRHLTIILSHYALAENGFCIFFYNFRKSKTCKYPVCNNTCTGRHSTHFPRFTYRQAVRLKAFPHFKPFTTPNYRV